jgi:hypothetical protein
MPVPLGALPGTRRAPWHPAIAAARASLTHTLADAAMEALHHEVTRLGDEAVKDRDSSIDCDTAVLTMPLQY